jgi:prenyltransferase beta subunit
MIKTIKNISNKFYTHIKKDGVFSALILTFKYLDFKFRITKRKLLLPLELRVRLFDKKRKIRNGLKIENIRKQTLNFIENMRLKNEPYGRYAYAPSQTKPVLYASLYAVLTRHLYNDLSTLTNEEKKEWAEYIKSFQSDDGWFRDPEIDCELAESADWWGWRHMTAHAIMALGCLGVVAEKQFSILEKFKEKDFIEPWFEELHIEKTLSPKMNAHLPSYLVVLLQYARDFQGAKWANVPIQKIIDLLNERIDPITGCWCTGNGQKELINEGVKIAYHFWIFYFYDTLRIKFPERAIDSVLSTQNSYGGFNNGIINSSACDDIDSIEPLCRFKNISKYREADIEKALFLSIPWILANMNNDGGFVFQRGRGFTYGHRKMYSGFNESNMFATWFRTLSLAYIGKTLPGSLPGKFPWHFEHIPGHQFWSEDEKLKK